MAARTRSSEASRERCTAALLGALLLAGSCSGPVPSASEVGQRYEEARRAYNDDGAVKALPLFEALLEDYRNLGDSSGEALALAQIGNCHKHFGEYPQALSYLEQALELNRRERNRTEEGWTLNSIGLVYWNMADYPSATDRFTKALEIARSAADPKLEATVLNNTALVYDDQGLYDLSRPLYIRVLEVFRRIKDRFRENYALGNLGGVFLLTGEFRQSADYYRQALVISRELGSKPAQAMDQGNLGLCLLGMGQVEEAREELDGALALAEETGQAKEAADWHRGKADLFLRTGEYPKALGEFQKALETYSRAGLKREQVEALEALGALQILLGEPERAEISFREGLETARAIGYRRGEIGNLVALGDLGRRRGDDEAALRLYGEALEVARDTADRLGISTVLIRRSALLLKQGDTGGSLESALQAVAAIEQTEAVFAESEAVLAVADALCSAGRFEEALAALDRVSQEPRALQDPEISWRFHHRRGHALEGLNRTAEALDSYDRAVDILQEVRYRLRDAGWSSAYLEDRYEPYLDVARLSIAAGRVPEAYQAAVELRFRTYLDLVGEAVLTRGSREDQPESELGEKISHLRRVIEEEKALPLEEQRPKVLESLVGELSSAQDRYAGVARMESGRSWRERLVGMAVPSLPEIQHALPEDAAVVEYLVGDDAIHCFVIRRRAIHARSTPVEHGELSVRVEFLRDTLLRSEGEEFVRPSRRLYDLLIAPVLQAGWLEGTRRLYIVPHRVLENLPFAALVSDNGDSHRFLVEDYDLTCLPSALLLVSDERLRAPASLLALAPARSGLKFPAVEVRGLARAFSCPVELLLGDQATESRFKDQAEGFRVVHLATHGTFNRWNPLLSKVTLEADQREDGDLHVFEILEMRLRADLVTLSACSTALEGGSAVDYPVDGDAFGLTRALLFAGAGSVLATLWDVDDQATARLVERFYQERRASGDAPSLAAVQRAMLGSEGRERHPRYWAGFELFGGEMEISAENQESGPLDRGE